MGFSCRHTFLRTLSSLCLAAAVITFICPGTALAQPHSLDESSSSLRGLLERYATDRASLSRRYDISMAPARAERMRRLHSDYGEALDRLDFRKLSQEEKIDCVLFQNLLRHTNRELDHESRRETEMVALIPFQATIARLAEARRRLEAVDARKSAEILTKVARQVEETREQVKIGGEGSPAHEVKRTVAQRAVRRIGELREVLGRWVRFYDRYDPEFTWWVREPYDDLESELEEYGKLLRKEVVGIEEGDEETIIGDPLGRSALLDELAHEMIAYTPEELIEIGYAELAWCREQMVEASRELGFGDDWKKALDHVKNLHVEPGRQPQLIRELAHEAERFLEERELVTVPSLCREIWRMEMMSPQRQRYTPYFTGGEVISVSFPTAGMSHEDKLMSMRGNNVHFSRATVHHELVPGHHLQGFMTSRHRTHRRIFSTPFWGEGWALYWEMLLWDLGFARGPEDRVGMLFWRSHRCARIIFSLSFHLERMTPEEAIEFLVDNVGHERRNATAEVRRSVAGGYGPLYQAAYMVGGLQIRSLHRDRVGSGKMTNRQFHDSILRQNSIPIAMVRAALTDLELSRNFTPSWRFYGDPAPRRLGEKRLQVW
jgi:uncharacterized protein (DUF885 family)